MFPPMTPTTERARSRNERLLSEHRSVTSTLPRKHWFAALRNSLSARRPAPQPQSRVTMEYRAVEQA